MVSSPLHWPNLRTEAPPAAGPMLIPRIALKHISIFAAKRNFAQLRHAAGRTAALQRAVLQRCIAWNEDRQLAILAGHDNDVMYQLDLELFNLNIETFRKC